ncbi:MAG: hypothetical protein KDA93_18820 [Planctomycetaceae bacterium]|nr:hypothetical protein [Planctomycetaceae bacterium]
MSRYSTILAILLVTACVCHSSAQEPTVAPEFMPPLLPSPSATTAPDYVPPASPVPLSTHEAYSAPQSVPPVVIDEYPQVYPVETVALYDRVRIRDPHKAHPYGVPTVISVADPRNRSCTVNVEVCMPPCACERVTHNLRGNRVRYDFGKYEIEVISRLGVVIIDYDT